MLYFWTGTSAGTFYFWKFSLRLSLSNTHSPSPTSQRSRILPLWLSPFFVFYQITQKHPYLPKWQKIPCWAWQQCLVHLNSPVRSDSFVLLPLWRQRVSHLSVSATLACIYNMSLRERLRDGANAWSPQRLRQLQLSFCYALDFQNQLWQSPRSRVGGRCKKMKKTVKDSVARGAVRAALGAHDPITLSTRGRLPSSVFQRETSQVASLGVVALW